MASRFQPLGLSPYPPTTTPHASPTPNLTRQPLGRARTNCYSWPCIDGHETREQQMGSSAIKCHLAHFIPSEGFGTAARDAHPIQPFNHEKRIGTLSALLQSADQEKLIGTLSALRCAALRTSSSF